MENSTQTTANGVNATSFQSSLIQQRKSLQAALANYIGDEPMKLDSFGVGATVAAVYSVASLGTAALLGASAGGVNNIVGIGAAAVAGGLCTKYMDNGAKALVTAVGIGIIGSHVAARTSEYLRAEDVNVTETSFV